MTSAQVTNPSNTGKRQLPSKQTTKSSASIAGPSSAAPSKDSQGIGYKMRKKRSVSDAGLASSKANHRKGVQFDDVEDMVRVCGKSLLNLPAGYSPGSLVVPTCIRATAHHLLYQGWSPASLGEFPLPLATSLTGTSAVNDVRGIFRVPGAVKAVNSLYDYYFYTGDDSGFVSGTVRCASLPAHVDATVHDIASTFKKFLSVLPGGVIGSLSVFDMLVDIYEQIQDDPTNLEESANVRARCIAVAIGTTPSQSRQELICAVFGLLGYLASLSETSARESEPGGSSHGLSQLMSADALGIVFGPLLVGESLDSYRRKLSGKDNNYVLQPPSTPGARKEKLKKKDHNKSGADPVNMGAIWTANSVTTMLIKHWTKVVVHISELRLLGPKRHPKPANSHVFLGQLPHSNSEPFVRRPGQVWASASYNGSSSKPLNSPSASPLNPNHPAAPILTDGLAPRRVLDRSQEFEVLSPTMETSQENLLRHPSSTPQRTSPGSNVSFGSPESKRLMPFSPTTGSHAETPCPTRSEIPRKPEPERRLNKNKAPKRVLAAAAGVDGHRESSDDVTIYHGRDDALENMSPWGTAPQTSAGKYITDDIDGMAHLGITGEASHSPLSDPRRQEPDLTGWLDSTTTPKPELTRPPKQPIGPRSFPLRDAERAPRQPPTASPVKGNQDRIESPISDSRRGAEYTTPPRNNRHSPNQKSKMQGINTPNFYRSNFPGRS